MILISILLALALEYFTDSLDRFRNYDWFDSYTNWIETRCNRFSIWNGPAGVLLTLAAPMLVLMCTAWLLGLISPVLPFLLSILVLAYSLGPNLNTLLNNYVQALEGNMDEDVAVIESRLNLHPERGSYNGSSTVSAILIRAHETIFGVVFWFIILGMAGAMLYCLTLLLKARFANIHGAYASAVEELHRILMWPSARLLAIGFALSGSLVDTLEAWRRVEGETLESSADVIIAGGLGALQFEESGNESDDEAKSRYIESIKETQALVNRSFIIWLIVLGITTLGGVLS